MKKLRRIMLTDKDFNIISEVTTPTEAAYVVIDTWPPQWRKRKTIPLGDKYESTDTDRD